MGKTQQDVADAIGMESYGNYERGKEQLPFWRILQLREYYRANINEMIEGGDPYMIRDNLRGSEPELADKILDFIHWDVYLNDCLNGTSDWNPPREYDDLSEKSNAKKGTVQGATP